MFVFEPGLTIAGPKKSVAELASRSKVGIAASGGLAVRIGEPVSLTDVLDPFRRCASLTRSRPRGLGEALAGDVLMSSSDTGLDCVLRLLICPSGEIATSSFTLPSDGRLRCKVDRRDLKLEKSSSESESAI